MIDIFMPSMGEGINEGIVTNVLLKIDDRVLKGEVILEVEADKATFDVPAETSGILKEILVTEGDKIRPGDIFMKMDPEIVEREEIAENKEVKKINEPPSFANDIANELLITSYEEKETKKNFSTPLARKLARELGIEISEITSSKRISFNDVKTFAKNRIHQENIKKLQNQSNIDPKLPNFLKFGNLYYQDISAIMDAMIRRMETSTKNIPHAWVQEKADITNLEADRQKHKNKEELIGTYLTITPFIVMAAAKILQAYPVLNSSLDVENNKIIIKEFINIGVAVDTEKGLIVPVIHNVEKLTLKGIACELTRISKDVKEHKAKLEDIEGATFTISNLGGIGTTSMNPIVDWPQVAILGISASKVEPVWKENEFVPRLLLPLCLGFDHRIITGAVATRFLQNIKNLLENHFLLLL